jgi:hypothetical protein
MKEWPERALGDAFSSLLGWTAAIAATLVLGFCAGYWIGHGEITSVEQTLGAFLWTPFLWLGHLEIVIAYAVLGLTWYLPLHYDSRRLRITAASANFLVWALVIGWIVVKTADWKFFRF